MGSFAELAVIHNYIIITRVNVCWRWMFYRTHTEGLSDDENPNLGTLHATTVVTADHVCLQL